MDSDALVGIGIAGAEMAKATKCRTCGEPITFMKSASGRWFPVNADERGNAKMCSGFVQGKGHRPTPDYHKCRQSDAERLATLRAHLEAAELLQAEFLAGNDWYDQGDNIKRLRELIAELE